MAVHWFLEVSISDCLGAIMPRRRSAADSRYSHENSILSYTEVEPSSRPAAVQAKESCLAIPPFTGVVSPLTPAKTKAQLGHHARTVVVPHVRAHEMKTWHHSSKNRLYWKDFSPVNWTMSQLAHLGPSFFDSQAWALVKPAAVLSAILQAVWQLGC